MLRIQKSSLLSKYLILFILACVMQLIVARADTLHSNLIIFGDSLSDSLSPSTNNPGYAIEPRLWGQYLVLNKQSFLESGELKTTASAPLDPNNDNIDFAVGGATAICPEGSQGANCLGTQLSRYLTLLATQASINPNTDIIIWIGGNDLLDNAPLAAADPAALAGKITTAISAAVMQIKNKETGTTTTPYKIYLINLPSLGKIPKFNGNPVAQAICNKVTSDFDADLADLQTSLSDPLHKVTLIDVNTLFNAITSKPTDFGFNSPSSAGAFSACTAAAKPDPKCEGYIFYDDIHPTTALHAMVANLIGSAVFPLSVSQS